MEGPAPIATPIADPVPTPTPSIEPRNVQPTTP
jgi:hypothetical protein